MTKYKFTDTNANPEDIKDPKKYVEKILSYKYGFGYQNVVSSGVYKLQGWAYDFRDELKKYVVKSDYYLTEMYHLNKTALRKQLQGFGRVHYIVEV